MPARVAAEALDFAPDLLAIQERPPARLPRTLGATIVLLLAMLLIWAVFARLDIIATAEGRLVPVTFTKVVQPAEAGVVTDILVKEGESVREGQLLLRLDPRLAQADAVALEGDVTLRKLSLRRIDAELNDRPFAIRPGEPVDLFRQVESQYRAHRQAHADAMAQEGEALNKARADLHAAQQVLAKLTRTLPSYQQSAEAFRSLVQEGFVGELAANEKSREALEREQDLKAQAANVEGLIASIGQSERRLTGIRSQYRAQLENERIETLAQLHRSGQELEKSNVRVGLLEIRAPSAGIVKDLSATTRGTVVGAGTLLMNIVPRDDPVQAEVLLKNEDAGFVSLGQSARIKVAAYPFQKYGMLDGRVALVAADAVDPRQQQAGQAPSLAYRAIVRLDSTHLASAAGADRLPLNPGMLVVAEIHQGSRSVLEYLFSPVQKVRQEAARER